jgi:hypothetical protein
MRRAGAVELSILLAIASPLQHTNSLILLSTNTFVQAPPQPHSPTMIIIAGVMHCSLPAELNGHRHERWHLRENG